MIRGFLDKALRPEATKLSPAAQTELDRRSAISPMNLTADEQSAIGRRLAFEAEEASRRPYQEAIRRVAPPTKEESAAIVAAEAAWQKAFDQTYIARALADDEDRDVKRLHAEGYDSDRADPAHQRRLAEARQRLHVRERELAQAEEEQARASQRLQLARSNARRGAAQRQAHVMRTEW